MVNIYEINIIQHILKIFKVKNIVISGLLDNQTLAEIHNYCNGSNTTYVTIDSKEKTNNEFINDYPLNVLPTLNNYDAIFLNDDPNWFTVFNELNIIKKNNEFPLVFICNNIFPHKWRDSYINPDIIPKEFQNNYSKNFYLDNICIFDDYYHAIDENTPKNGVSTAINDFLNENEDIKTMDIILLNGITILYKQNSINQIRLGKLQKYLAENKLNNDPLCDNFVQNQLLINYINKFNITKDSQHLINSLKEELTIKENSIHKFENQIDNYNDKINYNNSKIELLNSKLDLKDAEVKNYETQLTNKEIEFNNKINTLQKEKYLSKISKIENMEYCIHCYKEKNNNNLLEIQYLKKETLIKKILKPISYIYLLLKSAPNEVALNFKLYKALKNSKCFDIGYYLNNNKDLQDSKWCKYFSPELHYVCKGFQENRKFNKKYYNRNSKEELLYYILTCP